LLRARARVDDGETSVPKLDRGAALTEGMKVLPVGAAVGQSAKCRTATRNIDGGPETAHQIPETATVLICGMGVEGRFPRYASSAIVAGTHGSCHRSAKSKPRCARSRPISRSLRKCRPRSLMSNGVTCRN